MKPGLERTRRSDASSAPRRAAFPWRGGKFHLAPQIVELLPLHRIYVEVFGGAANVLLAKVPSLIEVYNDRNGMLVNLFETIRNHPLLFLERCQFLHYSRQLYQDWKKQLVHGFDGMDIDRVEAAVRTYYSIVSSFVGDPTKGWAFTRITQRGGADRWMSVWQRLGQLSERLRHVNIDCSDFRDCIKNWDSEFTFFFLDPPYVSSISKGFYGANFSLEDHKDLTSILASVKAKWLMTADDIPEVRKLYEGFTIKRIQSKLSSQKVARGTKRVDLHHILIANYPIGELNTRSSVPAVATGTPS